MICLDNTDTLEGGASVDAVVDFTVHGLVGGVFANLAQGQLSNTDPSVLYTATAAISVVSVVFVNTHNAAVTVNLYLDPANAGTPRRMIPKNLSLAAGYSMHFDGQRLTILDTDGNIKIKIGYPSGSTVQIVNYENGAVATGTTIMPCDNSVPQKTEGDQYMSLSITPKNASNKLMIDVVFVFGSSLSAGSTVGIALFQDDIAGALAGVMEAVVGANNPVTVNFKHFMVAGTASSTTFKVRAGHGIEGTLTLNGVNGNQLFEGTMASSMTITEFAA